MRPKTDVELARGLLASLRPDSIGDGWNHPGTTVAARVDFARRFHACSWGRFGEDVITAAAKNVTGCRWCVAQASAKAYGRERPRYSKATALLLGEPCRKCVNAWRERVAAFAARVEARRKIERQRHALVSAMKAQRRAQSTTTHATTPTRRRSTAATRSATTQAFSIRGQHGNRCACDRCVAEHYDAHQWRRLVQERRQR
ncbi:hypothetical protein [Haloechinothrix salitolerans]|uniref:Uncharacterized protein n=1 Tax=Haloechinothrix salitolerans TaxID=926830 RepID=A0ABW2C7L0_9PSEU